MELVIQIFSNFTLLLTIFMSLTFGGLKNIKIMKISICFCIPHSAGVKAGRIISGECYSFSFFFLIRIMRSNLLMTLHFAYCDKIMIFTYLFMILVFLTFLCVRSKATERWKLDIMIMS